ncbi:hypothetical protein Q7I21_04580 [Aeromonas veronii]|uniref:hypothetical protein n=1 Tax=Aeromonas veronii TaxID=654 RepID=UPI003003E4AE
MEDDLTWLARNVTDSHMCDWYIKVADGYSSMTGGTPTGMSGTWCSRKQIIQRRAELQNKPGWADAPEWANWLAQWNDGTWFWCDDEIDNPPQEGDSGWYQDGRTLHLPAGEVLGDWRDTLERRPVDLSEPAGGVKERGADGAEEINAMAQRLLVSLKSDPRSFDTGALAEMVELADAEIVKRDAKVCGGEGYLNNHWFERGELPPVGVECEFHGGARVGREWPDSLKDGAKVKVLCHYTPCMRPIAVFSFDIPGGKLTSQASEACFRPIRTERDLAVDEMMKDAGALQWETPKSIMLSLYDAGYRKQS